MIQSVACMMVLGAGLGTRLRPLTDELPKPLLPFGDRSLLEHAFRALAGAGLGSDVIVNTHHLAHEFERRKATFSLNTRLIYEPHLRGTAGGIAGARPFFERGPVVVATADVVLERVPPLFRESAESGGMVLAIAPLSAGAGPVGVDESGKVVRLRGRVFGREVEGGEYVGLLALGEQALRELPERGCYVKDYALPLLERGGSVTAFPYEAGFALPGDDLLGYLVQNLGWLERSHALAFVGGRATTEPSVRLVHAIVGDGAHVEGDGTLERAVVLPGARARAPLTGVIVAPRAGVIQVMKSGA